MSTKKSIKKVAGIYKIVNKINGKYYIGSSKNLVERKGNHFTSLKHQNHKNPHLQSSWNKYGADFFEFIVIEIIDDTSTLKDIEQKYLNEANRSKCYNVSYDAFRLEMTKEIRDKISRSHIGIRPSKETLKKKSMSMLGKCKGSKHYNYNQVQYVFHNPTSNQIFKGTSNQFYQTFNLNHSNVWKVIKGIRKSVGDWVVRHD